ncbi:MAG TPA: 50S ribosomal protein L13 [Fibrobacteraceae bacterium]|nr:50S ribosomal protein L13 [Fibrobacteraceae bacterium]
MKTVMVNPNNVERRWKLVDAQDKVLGRVASEVARMLMGKHKAIFSPNVDTGDFVVVINAEKILLTGDKASTKKYFHHTGHIGGERWTTFQHWQEKDPTYPLKAAIWGMLPHSALGNEMLKKLKIYAGTEHPHTAQNPELVNL